MDVQPNDCVLVLTDDNSGGNCEFVDVLNKSTNVQNQQITNLVDFTNNLESETKDLIYLSVKSATKQDFVELLRVLSKAGRLFIKKAGDHNASTKIDLLMAGFVKVNLQDVKGTEMYSCEKPNFDVGASVEVDLSSQVKEEATKIWSVSNDDLDNEDVLMDDDLLDENDTKIPDPESLKSNNCGVDKPKKACKNCSCGLAEELDEEARAKKAAQDNNKSSCGNCYLGDAFRCGTCPYLGTPAFKPGDKVILDL